MSADKGVGRVPNSAFELMGLEAEVALSGLDALRFLGCFWGDGVIGMARLVLARNDVVVVSFFILPIAGRSPAKGTAETTPTGNATFTIRRLLVTGMFLKYFSVAILARGINALADATRIPRKPQNEYR